MAAVSVVVLCCPSGLLGAGVVARWRVGERVRTHGVPVCDRRNSAMGPLLRPWAPSLVYKLMGPRRLLLSCARRWVAAGSLLVMCAKAA